MASWILTSLSTKLLFSISFGLLLSGPGSVVSAFDNTCNSNTAVYWGQNSYGATHTDKNNFQKTLSYYCQDNSIDVIPISFLNTFFGTGGVPGINLANICNADDNSTFPGTGLANCQALATDIAFCQSKGKILTISLGGATGGSFFSSDAQARTFADQVWNLFLGGSSSTRPFGSAVLDGVDLDIESGTGAGYVAFVQQLRTHFTGASKKYYVTAAPQCPYPDAALGAALNGANFDAVYVQFYNNACGLNTYPTASTWNFGTWDIWARTVSINKNVKIYIGAPASSTAAGSGYQPIANLQNIAKTMRTNFPSFGGVMLWDASQAYVNNRYEKAIKDTLTSGGSCGQAFKYPACTAPAWSATGNYPAGSQVTYNGYIWQAKWYASGAPNGLVESNTWSAISACSGTPTGTTTSSPTSTPGTGCAGVAAWSSSTVYASPGTKVSYNGRLWSNKWWTQGDVPGGSADVWADQGAC
ncbi:carbohydrate-binding module family 5 protein [Botryobasidium botryosum FD-172 SS1]|uniref:chitinase n=1 Tax=Botryobasidium botryosum (strain FD-172 SS1) TaxID=930990 RepID=A0A067N930_BOTB1|nr:carbohydrate-binding module family 5 protein [Botryobasidium botryosum FD-172 SS1]